MGPDEIERKGMSKKSVETYANFFRAGYISVGAIKTDDARPVGDITRKLNMAKGRS